MQVPTFALPADESPSDSESQRTPSLPSVAIRRLVLVIPTSPERPSVADGRVPCFEDLKPPSPMLYPAEDDRIWMRSRLPHHIVASVNSQPTTCESRASSRSSALSSSSLSLRIKKRGSGACTTSRRRDAHNSPNVKQRDKISSLLRLARLRWFGIYLIVMEGCRCLPGISKGTVAVWLQWLSSGERLLSTLLCIASLGICTLSLLMYQELYRRLPTTPLEKS